MSPVLPGGLDFRLATGLWLVCCAFVDVAVTASLCFSLYGKIVGFNDSTDNVIKAVIRIAVLSASYTSFFAFVGCVLSFSISTESLYGNATGVFYRE